MHHVIYYLLKSTLAICTVLLLLCVPQSGSPSAAATSNTLATYDCTAATGIAAADCEVLVTLYNETSGPSWTNSTDWLQTSTPCDWFGVTCVSERVTQIRLSDNKLNGSIPLELGQLSKLINLLLSRNQLSGSIPSEMGQLSNLTNLYLGSNQLSGAIPSELRQLANLTDLDLSRNQLDGSIPPELGQLVNLTDLDLGNNLLDGSIPSELGQLTNLTDLDLADNQLSGSIPPELGQLTNLTDLDLVDNQLGGAIPSELGQLINLTWLSLYNNQLSDPIPSKLGQLSNLTDLNLGNNQLDGSIPLELGQLSNLTYLNLHSNQLSGSIPSELGQLSNLTDLHLHSNQLGGAIPPELGQLTNLTDLDLADNQLSGAIPPELGQLSSLADLQLFINQLSGAIPPELGQLSNLDGLYLFSNQLSGAIPPELGQLTNLTRLYLGSNQLSGAIPPELGELSNLNQLYLHVNQLSGAIPPELGNLPNLNLIHLEWNQLSGAIPSELGNLSNLTDLHLHHNQLNGSIPASLVCLPTWPRLESLFINFNRLTAASPQAESCLDMRTGGDTWRLTQTIPPTNLQVALESPTSVRLSWLPVVITDTVANGYYEIGLSTNGGASYSVVAATDDKAATDVIITALTSGETYTFAARTYTQLDDNVLISEWSEGLLFVMPATPVPTITPVPSITPAPPTEDSDYYEDNDSCATAKSLEVDGPPQDHLFQDQGDTDWVTFDAIANTTYRIEVSSDINSLADVNLELYTDCEQAPSEQEAPSFNPGIRLDFEPPQSGPIYLRLKNFDSSLFGIDATYTLSVRQLAESDENRALIIVAGRLRGTDRLQTNINDVSVSVYNLFQRNGYTDDNIYFLATDSTLPGYDADATKDALRLAITDWAPKHLHANGTLTLYLMDHGSPELFYMDELNGQRMSPAELNEWLNQIESDVPGLKTNVFIEACQSGSFIDPAGGTISKSGRVIVTSTNAENDAKASPEGAYFSDQFLTGLHLGETLAASFERGRNVAMSRYALQDAWLDADGDGIPNEFADATLSAGRSFADVGTLASNQWAPHIFDVALAAPIENFRGTIEADVRDDLKVAQVYAVVYPPDYVAAENIQELQAETLPTFLLTATGEENIFAGIYPGFTQPGTYRVVVNAVDNGSLVAIPREIEVVVEAGRVSQEKLFLPFIEQ